MFQTAAEAAAEITKTPSAPIESFASGAMRVETTHGFQRFGLANGEALKAAILRPPPGTFCPHCESPMPSEGPGYPVVLHYDGFTQMFTVGAVFCSPACGLGYARDAGLPEQKRAWTRDLYLTYMKVSLEECVPALPRMASKRYIGGTLDSLRSPTVARSLTVVEAPMAPMAWLIASSAEPAASAAPEPTSSAAASAAPTASAASVSASARTRPLERDDPVALPRSTGAPPELLNFVMSRLSGSARTRMV